MLSSGFCAVYSLTVFYSIKNRCKLAVGCTFHINIDNILVTYLEMTQRPTHPPCLPPQADLKILREAKLSIAQYLYLQKTVGGPWQWDERLALTEDELDAIIHNPEVDLLVLYCGRAIAGFCEMDRRCFPDIEIKFFGLMPEFIGQGLGSYFLNRAIAAAWEHCPMRLWLHTDTNDHPRAVSTYERAGFQVYKQVMETFR